MAKRRETRFDRRESKYPAPRVTKPKYRVGRQDSVTAQILGLLDSVARLFDGLSVPKARRAPGTRGRLITGLPSNYRGPVEVIPQYFNNHDTLKDFVSKGHQSNDGASLLVLVVSDFDGFAACYRVTRAYLEQVTVDELTHRNLKRYRSSLTQLDTDFETLQSMMSGVTMLHIVLRDHFEMLVYSAPEPLWSSNETMKRFYAPLEALRDGYFLSSKLELVEQYLALATQKLSGPDYSAAVNVERGYIAPIQTEIEELTNELELLVILESLQHPTESRGVESA
jgi:hypothetical protein